MQRDEMHKGLLVRLLSEYSNVPTGTWATVDSTGIMRDGVWWFTVRWQTWLQLRLPWFVRQCLHAKYSP